MKKFSGKKLILVLAVVLITAGGAFAYGERDGKFTGAQGMNQQGQQMPCQLQAGPQQMPNQQGQQMTGQLQTGPQQMSDQRHVYGQRRDGQRRDGQRMGRRGCSTMEGHRFGGGRMGMWASVEIPQEIRDKQAEMGKLSIDMRNEMGKNPIDRSKIEDLYKKRVELRNELSGWRMTQRLDMMEKLQQK